MLLLGPITCSWVEKGNVEVGHKSNLVECRSKHAKVAPRFSLMKVVNKGSREFCELQTMAKIGGGKAIKNGMIENRFKKKQTQTRKENVFWALHSKKRINRIHLFGLSGLDLGTGSKEKLFSGKTKLSSVDEKTKT